MTWFKVLLKHNMVFTRTLFWPMIIKVEKDNIPADTDIFKTSSGRLKKVMTSYDQTRHRHNVSKKTSHL